MFDKKAYSKEYKKTHRAELKRNEHNYRRRVKERILTHYGQGKLACAVCEYSDVRALTLDHCNNDGAEKRRGLGIKGGGYNFYLSLEKQGYPDGFLTLCWNCQWIKESERRKVEKLRRHSVSSTQQ